MEKLFSLNVKDIDETSFEITTTTRVHVITADSGKSKNDWLNDIKQVCKICFGNS